MFMCNTQFMPASYCLAGFDSFVFLVLVVIPVFLIVEYCFIL